jgi:Flp pilus assembly protein TadB
LLTHSEKAIISTLRSAKRNLPIIFGRFFVIYQEITNPNHMKKFIYSLALIFMLGVSANTVLAADKSEKNKTEMTVEQQAQLKRITERVEEIRSMDKSDLSRAEKKELRKELRELKKQSKALGGGVYLSVGAIIIIILLLILIL